MPHFKLCLVRCFLGYNIIETIINKGAEVKELKKKGKNDY